MDSDTYKNYITEKYDLETRVLLQQFSTIDAMQEFISVVEWSDNTYFKGAMSLFTEHGYQRENPTKDIDVSIKGNLKRFKEDIYSSSPIITKHYKIDVTEYEDLNISNNGYSGIKIRFKFAVCGTTMKGTFSIDVAIEEIPDKNKTSKLNSRLYVYSIEKTLAEKFVSMIHWKEKNTREKDFIDLKALLPRTNWDTLIKYIDNFLNTKNIDNSDVKSFVVNYKNYEYVKKYNLSSELSPIIKWVKSIHGTR